MFMGVCRKTIESHHIGSQQIEVLYFVASPSCRFYGYLQFSLLRNTYYKVANDIK